MRNNTFREMRNLAGFFRGGKLAPVMLVGFEAGESGLLSQTATLELSPVAGRLITPITCELYAVFVPVQASLRLKAQGTPEEDTAGITEVIRQKHLDGSPIFSLVAEDEVTKRLGVMPVSIGGTKMVSEEAILAHICAVNFLRQRLYTYAALLDKSARGVTPALLSSTALDMFNAVLNPDDHINGMVSLELSSDRATVRGVNRVGALSFASAPAGLSGASTGLTVAAGSNALHVDLPAAGESNVYADLAEVEAGGFSLTQLYNAETMDRLTRSMRTIIDRNPVDGEEQVVRWAHGLSVDDDQNPWLLAYRSAIFGQDLKVATDMAGIEAETTQSRFMQRLSITIPVPQTELGGSVVTFLVVKPDEVLKEQPHPLYSRPRVLFNRMAEELQNDPVPVTAREVQAGVPQASESSVVFYTGFNELRRAYINYGWNRHVDPALVDVKNQLWQYEIPASVTPENIVYPDDIPHYPFLDQEAEIARYMIASTLVGSTPMFFGPSPVETVSVIEDADLFGDVDA